MNEFLTGLESCRSFCVCTTNRREGMDAAAMRRFSFKVSFAYAKAAQLTVLYASLLRPLAGFSPPPEILDTLCRQTRLAPGDFHAVRMQYWLKDPGTVAHETLLSALLREQAMKLDHGKTVGFMASNI